MADASFVTLRNTGSNCFIAIFKRRNLYFGAAEMKQELNLEQFVYFSLEFSFTSLYSGIIVDCALNLYLTVFSDVRAFCLDKYLSGAYDASYVQIDRRTLSDNPGFIRGPISRGKFRSLTHPRLRVGRRIRRETGRRRPRPLAFPHLCGRDPVFGA